MAYYPSSAGAEVGSGVSRPCQFCHDRPQRPPRSGSRGLCRRCYSIGAIRERFLSGRLIEEDGATAPPMPAMPTSTSPGSAAKIGVMSRRYSQGRAIFHPLDHPMDIDAFLRMRARRRRNLGNGVML